MSLKKPRKFFENSRLYNTNPSTNMERFKQKYEKKKALLSNSLAPEITNIVKSKNYLGWILLIINSLLLLKFLSLSDYKFISYPFIYLVTVISISIFLIYREKLFNPLRKKQPFISISNIGILILYKPKPTFFEWKNVRSTRVYSSDETHWLMINENIIDTTNLKYNNEELEYLLKVYKSRSEGRKIELLPEFENQYLNLNKRQRKEYTL